MAFKNSKWEIVSAKGRKKVTVKDRKLSVVGNSFYFIWPRSLHYPLYVWYIIEDYWPKALVWILRRDNWKQTECTMKKSLLTYDKKNDYKEERDYYCSNISSTEI